MLEVLRRLIQDVNAADSLEDALALIVAQVRAAMHTDVCTVYLHDKATQKLVFRATEGLNSEKVGQFGLGFDEGLVGWVATREEPLNLDDASAHPQFQLVEGLGEEPFNAFLGAPIVHQRDLLGVLVVQQGDHRRFSEDEEAFLITVSAQLAGLIAHAELAGVIRQSPAVAKDAEGGARLSGVAACSGIGIGTAAWISPHADLQTVPSREATDRRAELKAFREALASVRADIQQVAENLEDELGPEDRALFGVYLSILDDSALGGEVAALIKAGEWAQGALSQVMLRHIRHFERMEHSYLRERAVDVRDLGTRVLGYLQDADREEAHYPEATVLVAEELTASALGEIPREKLVGIVSMRGSANSHTAILARAMGIPAVVGVEDLPLKQLPDRQLVVDGYNGRVYVNPHPDLLSRFEGLLAEDEALFEELAPLAEQKGSPLLLEVYGGYGEVEADPRRLRRIVLNFIGNAIDHGELRPIVTFIDSNEQAVAIAVRDWGVGMDEREVARVFDRFWRADPSRQRSTGGTGLGLAIAQEDALAHDGRIDVWSELGVGTCFRVVLPRSIQSSVNDSPLPLPPETDLVDREGRLVDAAEVSPS